MQHNRFFEINLNERNTVNRHHWRSNIARPFRQIDHVFRHVHSGSRSGVWSSSHNPGPSSNTVVQPGDSDSDSTSDSDQQDIDSSLSPETQPTSLDSSDGPELSLLTAEAEATSLGNPDELPALEPTAVTEV